MMEVTIHVPTDIAARWQAQGDIPRAVLEGAALEAYTYCISRRNFCVGIHLRVW